MLTVNDVVKDYDAVMTSVDHLRGVFGPHSTWPRPDLTLEQDLIDLGWHQKEFQRRRSFSYTVVAPDESTEPAYAADQCESFGKFACPSLLCRYYFDSGFATSPFALDTAGPVSEA